MLYPNSNYTVDFLTQTAILSSSLSQQSMNDCIKSHLDSLNTVLKTDQPTAICLETNEKSLPAVRPKRAKKNWSFEEELEYFCGVITFAFQNPYLRVSWEEWKPRQFYNFLQSHMENVFGAGCIRKNKQIKAKDQNLKLQHYKKNKKGEDMLQVALRQVEQFVKKTKRSYYRNKPLSTSQVHRMLRFDNALTRYKEFVEATKKKGDYEQAIQKLVNFEKSMQSEIDELWSESMLC